MEAINYTGEKNRKKVVPKIIIPEGLLDFHDQERESIIDSTKKSLGEFTFSTTNDNSPFSGINGSDIGKTAGFKGDYKDDNYKVSVGLDMYTGIPLISKIRQRELSKQEVIDLLPNFINGVGTGGININNYDFTKSQYYDPITKRLYANVFNPNDPGSFTNYLNTTRIDFAHINMTKKVFDEKVNGFNVKGYFGGGINIIGNLGGKKIQDKWHNINAIPLNMSHYENTRGFSPTINGSLEIDRIIYGINKNGVSIYGNLDAQLALIHKYGSNNINATIGIKGEYEGFGVDISRTEGYSSMPTASKTFKDLKLSGHISTTSMKLYAPLIRDLSIYFKVKKDNIQKSRHINDPRSPYSNTTKLNSKYQSELGVTYKF